MTVCCLCARSSVMANAFVTLLETASMRNWCMKPFCTTCGSTDYREAVADLADRDSGAFLAESMAAVRIETLTAFPNWAGAVTLAWRELRSEHQGDRVLSAWLPSLDHHPGLADVVLFYILRQGSLFARVSHPVWRLWLDESMRVAIATGNGSLLETLSYTMGKELDEHAELRARAEEVAQSYPKLRRALDRARAPA